MFLSFSKRFPHSLAKCGKKDDSKTLVLALEVFIDSLAEDRVKYVLKDFSF